MIFPSKKHIKYADNARSVTFTKKYKYYVRFSKCYAKNYASIINSWGGEGRGGEGRGGEGVGKNWRMLTKLRDVLSEPRMLKSTVNCKSPEANVTSSTSENYRKFHHQNVP